jgi:hypothetical protein
MIELSRRLVRASAALLFAFSALTCCLAQCFSQEVQDANPPNADLQSSSGSDDRNVLQNLVQYDSIYRSGFALSATERRLDQLAIGGPLYRVEARWRLTFEGARVGFVMEVTDYESPSYLPPDQRPWAADRMAGKGAKDEAMLVAVRTKKWGYWGDEACGNHYVDTTLKVTPDGQVTQAGTMYNSSLFAPRDITPIADRSCFLWALGRFFSEHLDKVTEVTESSEDGRLHVSALGNRYEGNDGKWELEIEPAAAWMVRKARFYTERKPDRIKVEMSNEGTVWSGSFCVPQKARGNYFGPAEDIEAVPTTYSQHTHHFTFGPVVDGFDEELYRQSQQAVLHGEQPKLTVTDERVSPPTITQPNLPEPEPTKAAPSAASPLRGGLIIVNVIVVVVLFLLFLVLRKWRKANRSVDA